MEFRYLVIASALAVTALPTAASCQDGDERIVFSVPHGNFGADNSVAIAGELDGYGTYRVEISWELDADTRDAVIRSTFGDDAVFSLAPDWRLSGIPSVFEREGEINLFIPLEHIDGRCGPFVKDRYRLSIPLNFAENGEIVTAFGCDRYIEPVVVRRN